MIHCSSENISDSLIIDAEKYFGCKLINYFGQVEQAVLGQNLHNSLYITILPYTNYYLTENNTIAALNLVNWSTPMINYEVKDKFLVENNNEALLKIIGRSNIVLIHESGHHGFYCEYFYHDAKT